MCNILKKTLLLIILIQIILIIFNNIFKKHLKKFVYNLFIFSQHFYTLNVIKLIKYCMSELSFECCL